ncbi:MAG: acyltransferase [Methanomassiliicoccus sp.]|nr:acyltransferase [Methanomassiliicoccus sp.]
MRRLMEADILRTAAIVLVVLTHLPDYFPVPGLQSYTVYTIVFGNGLFIFLSGYLIHSSTRSRTQTSLASFMGHRLLRLMPLYWVALATFVLLVARPDLPTMVMHVAGLQILLAPALVTPMATLWFIGMILIFYLVYYAAIRPASGPRAMIVLACVALLPFAAMRLTIDLLEIRFFLYYFVFMAGAVACESGWLERASPDAMTFPAALAIASLVIFIVDGSPLIGEGIGPSGLSLVFSMAVINVMIVCWTVTAWLVAKRIAPLLRPWAARAFAACSVASYFVYLFHRPALVVISSVLGRTGLTPLTEYLTALLIVLPALFIVGYLVQGSVDRLTKQLISRPQSRPQ